MEALGGRGDEVGVAEEEGAAVVAGVVVRGQGEDEAVELGGADADGDAAAASAAVVAVTVGFLMMVGVAVCGSVAVRGRGPLGVVLGTLGEAEDPRRDVAVEVDDAAFALVRARRVRVCARAAEHGEDDGERRVALFGGGGEGDVQDGRFVDDGVDGLIIIFAWDFTSGDFILAGLFTFGQGCSSSSSSNCALKRELSLCAHLDSCTG